MKFQSLAALTVSLAFFTPLSSEAALVSYTLGPGDASGTLSREALPTLTVTGFTITATADTSTVLSGNFGGTYPINYNPVVPTMEIQTTGGTLSFTLPTVGAYSWYAVAGSGTTTSVHGFYLLNGIADVPLSAAFVTNAPGPYSDLASLNVYSGTAGGYLINLPNSEGTLNLTPSANPGTFTISAVPEPAAAAATFLSALSGLLLVSRRQRRS